MNQLKGLEDLQRRLYQKESEAEKKVKQIVLELQSKPPKRRGKNFQGSVTLKSPQKKPAATTSILPQYETSIPHVGYNTTINKNVINELHARNA